MKRSLRSWIWRVPIDEEVDEEIAFHVEMRTRELVERGMDPESARINAIRRLGDARRLHRTCVDIGRKRDREMRITTWLHELRDDVRFAMRQMRRAPAFTAIAALTLALGIGANSAIFALVDATLLRPLPFPEPERLVTIWERTEMSPRSAASPLNVLDWHERNRTFERISGYVPNVGGMVMNGRDGTSETVPRQWVLAGFFDVLGVKPIAGRTFLPSDNRERASVVVLNEGFWRRRFGSDPALVGSTIRLDGMPFTVVGVVPEHSELLSTDVWALLAVQPVPGLRSFYGLRAIGRLKKGITIEAAGADLTAVAEGLERELPETNKGRSVALESMEDTVVGRELRLTSILFLAVVGLVLVICCANVANLVIARATVRSRELAIRSALGAGRLRVIRQLLTESLLLSLVGGGLAIAVSAAILAVAPSLIPTALLPPTVTLAFDWRVAAFCAAAAVGVGVTFGLVPAVKATRTSSAQVMAADSRTTTDGGGGRVRGLLVVAEVATAVVLLFGASLLLRTLIALSSVDRGYHAEHVLSLLMDPLGSSYPTPESLQQFYDAVEREIRVVPGVQQVAWASTLPLGPSYFGTVSVEIVGRAQTDQSTRVAADYQVVSPSYFETLGIPIVTGRRFADLDRGNTTPVCIVNEAFARKHLAGLSPIGARVAVRRATTRGQGAPIIREVVGVARQVKGRPDEPEDLVQVYVPMAQDLFDDTFLVVRSRSQVQGLAASVRQAIAQVDKEQLVSVTAVRTLDDVAWEATSRHRFRAVLVMTFAALALVLAMVGVFGILAYSVQQRVRDFGVRRALGATATDVVRLVVRSAARVVLAGVLIGLVAAAALGRLLDAVLFGVQASDPVTFVVVTLLLFATAGFATAWPAWRAIRIDPVAALRSE
jgi:putative ABC transport system permease protein